MVEALPKEKIRLYSNCGVCDTVLYTDRLKQHFIDWHEHFHPFIVESHQALLCYIYPTRAIKVTKGKNPLYAPELKWIKGFKLTDVENQDLVLIPADHPANKFAK